MGARDLGPARAPSEAGCAGPGGHSPGSTRHPSLPRLIEEPLPFLGLLARSQGLALALDAGLLVVLTLPELGHEPGLFALLLEALERVLEALVGLDDYLGHPEFTPLAFT